jgi:tRNA dimethylallyltransferase
MRETALEMYGSTNAIDHTEGIFQAIGYKEFAELKLPQDDPASDRGFPAMLSQTKAKTYQYARSQLKWIRKQLLPAIREARALGGDVEIYAVPGGEAGEEPSRDILGCFLKGEDMLSWRSIGHTEALEQLERVYAEGSGVTSVPDTAESVRHEPL